MKTKRGRIAGVLKKTYCQKDLLSQCRCGEYGKTVMGFVLNLALVDKIWGDNALRHDSAMDLESMEQAVLVAIVNAYRARDGTFFKQIARLIERCDGLPFDPVDRVEYTIEQVKLLVENGDMEPIPMREIMRFGQQYYNACADERTWRRAARSHGLKLPPPGRPKKLGT